MFNASEKIRQHYVPQFWQKRFADKDGKLHVLKQGNVRVSGSKKLMSGDWIYTTYDSRSMPTNQLEDMLGELEGRAAQAMRRLDENPGSAGSTEDQLFLRWFIALSACRHPDIMGSGFRRGKELAYVLADAHSVQVDVFQELLADFGLAPEDAEELHRLLLLYPEEELLNQAEDIEHRPPNDPALPIQLALDSETVDRLFFLLSSQQVTILDAPIGQLFVLGDTPLGCDLGSGFILPLSSQMALLCERGGGAILPDWGRRQATVQEVKKSNKVQFDNSAAVVIGASKSLLEAFLAP